MNLQAFQAISVDEIIMNKKTLFPYSESRYSKV